MLAGAGLGDDARFAHAAGQQGLAERVVDLVRTGVQEVLALQVDLCAAAVLRQPLGVIKRRGSAGVFLEMVPQLGLGRCVLLCSRISRGQLLQRGHQRFGHKHSAIGPEMPAGIGQGKPVEALGGLGGGHKDGQRGH